MIDESVRNFLKDAKRLGDINLDVKNNGTEVEFSQALSKKQQNQMAEYGFQQKTDFDDHNKVVYLLPSSAVENFEKEISFYEKQKKYAPEIEKDLERATKDQTASVAQDPTKLQATIEKQVEALETEESTPTKSKKSKARKAVERVLNKAIGRAKVNGSYNKTKGQAVAQTTDAIARKLAPDLAVDAVKLGVKGAEVLGQGTIAGARVVANKAVSGAAAVGGVLGSVKESIDKANTKENRDKVAKVVGYGVMGTAATVATGGVAPAALGAAMLYKRRRKIGQKLVDASAKNKVHQKFQDRLDKANKEKSTIVAAANLLKAGQHYAAQTAASGLSRAAKNIGQALVNSKQGYEGNDSLAYRAAKTLIPKEIRSVAKGIKSSISKFKPGRGSTS